MVFNGEFVGYILIYEYIYILFYWIESLFLGLLLYSEHIDSRKGHFKVYLHRKMVVFNAIAGDKRISLRYFYQLIN